MSIGLKLFFEKNRKILEISVKTPQNARLLPIFAFSVGFGGYPGWDTDGRSSGTAGRGSAPPCVNQGDIICFE
jgi:hypothetical protein